jgi:hypothetical protein
MYPHERSLVEKMEGKPFVIIGVNSDASKEALKKVLEKEKITWRSFWNGGSTDGPIAKDWNVQGWPTLYLIDHKGIIKKKWLGGPGEKALDEMIEKFVKAASNEQKAAR